MTNPKRHIPKKRLIISAVLLLLGIGGVLAAMYIENFADIYGFTVYPLLENIFSHISGIFPFSAAEILIILGVLLALFSIVYFIVNMIKRKGGRLRFLASSLSSVLLCGSVILFVFVYSSGINYYRMPFSVIADLHTEKYTKEQLCETLEHYIGELNASLAENSLDSAGHIVMPENVSDDACEAMKKLTEKFPFMNINYSRIKPVMLSELMSYGHIVGIYTGYTMEANYNTSNVPESIGHTMCHELSHLTGFMREDEANFISFLACRGSECSYLNYSGYYCIVTSLLNAYYPEAGMTEYSRVMSQLDPRIYYQIVMQNEYWEKYETDFGEAAEAINDTYLKINHQPEGTKSYGRVVDLVIADYLADKS